MSSLASRLSFGTGISPINYVALMDEAGRWREVPANTLSQVPHVLRMKITPAVAKMILEQRNIQNRKIDRRRVAKYVSDMLKGEWHIHGNGIQFNRSGQLIDGQHRLQAIIESGLSIDFMVTFGVHESAVVAIDEGRPRSNLDVARILGFDDVSKFGMSIGGYLLEQMGVKAKRSRGDILRFIQTHAEAISFVTDRLQARNMTKAPIGAAIARAYYHVRHDKSQKERLELFIDLLQRSSVDLATFSVREADIGAVTLMEFVVRSHGKNTGPFRDEMFRKTESALVYFLDNRPIRKLYGNDEEQFPLPEEVHHVPV